MTKKMDFFNSLQRMNELVDRLEAEGISRETARAAALMTGLGSKEGAALDSALLQACSALNKRHGLSPQKARH